MVNSKRVATRLAANLDHEGMAKSFRSEPRRIRAARRAVFPAVRARRPAPGRHHPASAADVREALKAFGDEAYYGVKRVELIPAPHTWQVLPLGQLIGPGEIVLYDQAPSPWRLGHLLPARESARFEAAGAEVADQGIVSWPAGTLRRFMLGYVLTHELGHHILQHERRLRDRRAARTSDHEARAEAIASELRTRLP